MSRQFYEARKIYREYIQYEGPVSYQEWLSKPEDHKAAFLYVQFFDQIILAWYKLYEKYPYTSEEEGVETVCQYLLKNVSKIEENEKRYTESYLYKVAYNCLYCISHDRIGDRERYFSEKSNVVDTSEDGPVDMFDFIPSKETVEDNTDSIRNEFWKSIQDLGDDAVLVANHLMDGKDISTLKKISDERKEYIMKMLTIKLFKYKEYYY